MGSWLREQWKRRPWWMSVLMLFCIYMTLIYVPWDLFAKPVAADEEVWFGVRFHGTHAKLLAIPWRAYSEIDDTALRDAIVMFFEDAGSGEKLGTAATAPRLAGVVASLEPKEPQAERRARLHRLAENLKAQLPPDVN